MTDNTEKITESEFFQKIQTFYTQLQAKWGYPIQPRQLSLPANSGRIEVVFQSVMTGQVAYLWFNRNTGLTGWGMTAPIDLN